MSPNFFHNRLRAIKPRARLRPVGYNEVLTDGLRGGKKGSDSWSWNWRAGVSAAMDAAFAGAKQALLSATHLAHPSVGAELSVVVDASPTPWHGCQALGQLACPGNLSYVAEYTSDICHIAGAATVVADTL
jgi:hypothetical protein